MGQVTAILVTYNSVQAVGAALASLKQEPDIAQVIVVDNASSDGTGEHISKDFPDVTLIRNDKNMGFGAGNNIALERVNTAFALLINPDAVLQAGALATLLEAAACYPDAGILAPQLFYEDGKPQPSYKPDVFTRERQHAKSPPPDGDLCAGFLSGAVWLVRMEALKQTSFFDPAIFFYYEDDDVCMRMRKAGYAPMLVQAARATHGMGKSSVPSFESRQFRLYHDTWSRLYIEYKYRSDKEAWKMGQHWCRKYGLLLFLGNITFIRSLVHRYRPRLRAALDFMAFLSMQP